MKEENNEETEITKELVIKALSVSLSENNSINSLIKDQLEGNASFPKAEEFVGIYRTQDIRSIICLPRKDGWTKRISLNRNLNAQSTLHRRTH